MFAKFFLKITACTLFFLLAACSSTPQTSSNAEINHSEAVKARINLALAYLAQNDFPKAKQNIDKAIAHDKNDYLPQSVLAYFYQQTGDNNKAATAYQQALTLSNNRPDVLNNYGTFLCKQGQFESAYQQFEKAIASKLPYYHQADTLENIVLCAKQEPNEGKMQEALRELEKLDLERANRLK